MGQSVDDSLNKIVVSVGEIRGSLERIVHACRSVNAHGIGFAGDMLLNALDSFEQAVIRYVSQRERDGR